VLAWRIPKLKGQLTDLDSSPLSGSPADFGELIVEETEKWGRVIRAANIKPEARADRYSSTPSVVNYWEVGQVSSSPHKQRHIQG
jgi:hypothetical protein